MVFTHKNTLPKSTKSIPKVYQKYTRTGAFKTVSNSGNYKGVSPGGILRNLTSKYGNLKASQELERFANKNGLTLGELNLFLITSSFLGNKIVGSRFKDEGFFEDKKGKALSTNTGAQGLTGMFDRVGGTGLIDSDNYKIASKIFSAPFDVIDVVLGYQGLLTASSYDFIKNGRSGETLFGHSLGTLDASNLLSRGYVGNAELFSVPFGFVAPSGSIVNLGTGDGVNGFILGIFPNPWARFTSVGLFKHGLKRYVSLPKP